jgi:hypothetical protein
MPGDVCIIAALFNTAGQDAMLVEFGATAREKAPGRVRIVLGR